MWPKVIAFWNIDRIVESTWAKRIIFWKTRAGCNHAISCIMKLMCAVKRQNKVNMTNSSENYCIVNVGIKHWSPSKSDLRINIYIYHVVIKPCRENINKGINHLSSILKMPALVIKIKLHDKKFWSLVVFGPLLVIYINTNGCCRWI